MIGEDAGEHGFGHGNAANTDTRVMAAFGAHVDFITLCVNGFDGGEHRGGGLDRDANNDFVPIRYAA